MISDLDLLFQEIKQNAKYLNSSNDGDTFVATIPIPYRNTSNAQSNNYQLCIQFTEKSNIKYGFWNPVSGAIYTTSEINYPPENARTVTYQLAIWDLKYLSDLLNSPNRLAPLRPTR